MPGKFKRFRKGKNKIRFGDDRVGRQNSSPEEDSDDCYSLSYIASKAKNGFWGDVRHYIDSYLDVSATLSDGTDAFIGL